MPVDTTPVQPTAAVADCRRGTRYPLSVLFAVAVGVPLAAEAAVLFATGQMRVFLWLVEQDMPFVAVAWPISLPLVVWVYVAHRAAARAGQLGDRRLLWLAPLLVIPITMLVWGAVFANPGDPGGRGFVAWPLVPLKWSFFTSVGIAVLAVIFNPGRRPFVAAASLLLLLYAFFCAFTAGCSVTGDWM